MATICTSDGCVTKYFVYISGENIDLAKAEISALSRLLHIKTAVTWDGRMALIESHTDPVSFFLDRAALVKEAGIVLSEVATHDDLCEGLSDDLLISAIGKEETFSVRTISEREEFPVEQRLELETAVGARIKQVVGARVDLENPQIRILVFFTQNSVRICKSITSTLRPMLRAREPGRKAFFHPSMMNATLSRVMCNLARVVPNEVVLDPFCGGGGILSEASLIGARTVGIDLNWELLTGSEANLSLISSDYSIIQGDIRSLPIDWCDCIVTDPPYGRTSSTRGAQSIGLVESLFRRADSVLRRHDESICICGSSEMNLKDLADSMGFVIGQVLQIRVHSGLVREILTLGI